MEAWVDTLSEKKVVQEDAVKKLREELDELRKQDQSTWYNPSSLEAADELRLSRGWASQEVSPSLTQTRQAEPFRHYRPCCAAATSVTSHTFPFPIRLTKAEFKPYRINRSTVVVAVSFCRSSTFRF
jgi:hypothetical protein